MNMDEFTDRIMNMLAEARAKQPERRARILARSSWKETGHALLQVQFAAELVLEFDEIEDDIANSGLRLRELKPEPSARLLADRAQQVDSKLNPNNTRVEEALVKAVGGAHENLSALAWLMFSDGHMRPAFALGRVLLEASAHGFLLMNSALDICERSGHAANLDLSDLADAYRDVISPVVSEATDEERAAAADCLQEMHDIVDAARRDGKSITKARRGSPIPGHVEPQLRTEQIMNLMAEHDLGGGRDAWRWLSSAVHVRERPALLLTAGVGNIGFGLEGRSHAVSFLAPAIVAAFSTLQVFAEYQGKNTDLLDRSIELALPVLASAMGLADDA